MDPTPAYTTGWYTPSSFAQRLGQGYNVYSSSFIPMFPNAFFKHLMFALQSTETMVPITYRGCAQTAARTREYTIRKTRPRAFRIHWLLGDLQC
jgi:hypothetical protein